MARLLRPVSIALFGTVTLAAASCSSGGLAGKGTTTGATRTVPSSRSTASIPPPFDPAHVRLRLRLVAGGLQAPLFVTGAGDGSGRLYVALGDGGSEGDPGGNGQNLGTLLGKPLRIDVNHPSDGRAYGIPPDNPFVGRAGARPEIWAYGLRNPWRFSFDRVTHELWIGDVGQDSWEEVDRAAAGRGGQKYGWNVMEGPSCFKPMFDCDRSGLTLPVAAYRHTEGNCTVIGGYAYRGQEFPALRGGYLYGDYCSGRIWVLDAAAVHPRPVLGLDT